MEVRTQKWEIHKSNENFTEILWMLQPFYLFYYPVIHVICRSRMFCKPIKYVDR